MDHSKHHSAHVHGESSHYDANSWAMARSATLHCLTGCSIGEVTGIVLGTALGLSTVTTIALAVALAFTFGYALTYKSVRHLGRNKAIKTALAADSVSIAIMEIVDNSVILGTGAMHLGLGSWQFWVSLGGSLVIAGLVVLPINKWLIGKGKGHALVH